MNEDFDAQKEVATLTTKKQHLLAVLTLVIII